MYFTFVRVVMLHAAETLRLYSDPLDLYCLLSKFSIQKQPGSGAPYQEDRMFGQ